MCARRMRNHEARHELREAIVAWVASEAPIGPLARRLNVVRELRAVRSHRGVLHRLMLGNRTQAGREGEAEEAPRHASDLARE
jgi:hypothetical protein